MAFLNEKFGECNICPGVVWESPGSQESPVSQDIQREEFRGLGILNRQEVRKRKILYANNMENNFIF